MIIRNKDRKRIIAYRIVFILFLAASILWKGSIIAPSYAATTEGEIAFGIKRIALYFENKLAETTVESNFPGLKAYADISYVGSGLLQGYWEVDGRILSQVNQHVTFSSTITLQTLEVPSLPTFDAGSHVVRFVITNPPNSIPSPTMIYFVIPRGITCSTIATKLISPAEGAEVAYAPLQFKWEKMKDTTLFLIGFYGGPKSKPLFSAYTRSTSYTMPESVVKSHFKPSQKYYWKVVGFDEENKIICENVLQSFSFKKVK